MIEKLIKYRIAVTIIFFGLEIIWLFSKASFDSMENAGLPAWICLILLLIFWVIILIDMIRTSFYNKTFWILALIILPYLTPAFYLFQRNKLQHLRNNKFKK